MVFLLKRMVTKKMCDIDENVIIKRVLLYNGGSANVFFKSMID
jgi:hypothetical protein